jgi:hypothetical protein
MKISLTNGVASPHKPQALKHKTRHDFTVSGSVEVIPIVDGMPGTPRIITDADELLEKAGIEEFTFTAQGADAELSIVSV